jgi:hypothetical protein
MTAGGWTFFPSSLPEATLLHRTSPGLRKSNAKAIDGDAVSGCQLFFSTGSHAHVSLGWLGPLLIPASFLRSRSTVPGSPWWPRNPRMMPGRSEHSMHVPASMLHFVHQSASWFTHPSGGPCKAISCRR